MSENIQLPNQVFPTTHGEVNLAEVDNECKRPLNTPSEFIL